MSTPFPGPQPDPVIAPDGYPTQTAPLAGWSMERTCTGTAWYDDADRTVQQAESLVGALGRSPRPWQQAAVSPLVPVSQRLWFLRHWSVDHRGGFRVECLRESRHSGQCRFPTGPATQ